MTAPPDPARLAAAESTVADLRAAGHYRAAQPPTAADITQAVMTFQTDAELDAVLRLPSPELNRRLLHAWGHI